MTQSADTGTLREQLASGVLDAVSVVRTCLDRIVEREAEVQAWEWLDEEYALSQAQARDRQRRQGRPTGALHGLPVALKDIIDTNNMPSTNGTSIDAARMPSESAWLVDRLEAEGAIVLGKTVSAELAYLHPGKTRNPANLEHTPGGSSSGSAAAVADEMVPLAVGTQTGGSVIRPAAFCGVVGYKPSFGAIPRSGVLNQSQSLDTIGVFASDVAGVALLAEQLFGHDRRDTATAPAPFPRLYKTSVASPSHAPRFGFVKTPYWSRADTDTQTSISQLAEALGEYCVDTELPACFDNVAEIRERINLVEMAANFRDWHSRGAERLSSMMRDALEQGRHISAIDYLDALDCRRQLIDASNTLFQRFDVMMTPAAPGPAPAGLDSTGDSIFNGMWTLCGNPSVTVPSLTSSNGMPLGIQLVARRGDDAQLLRTANWLSDFLRRQHMS